VQVIVVYKVDRLTRSLADFAKLVERFDADNVSFVSVTQQFNTTSSMGRLTLNVLLSFAQFEREVTGERIRDKIAASKKKGLWMGGIPPIGYLAVERSLVVDEAHAQQVREIYVLYRALGCVRQLKLELERRHWTTAARVTRRANAAGGRPFSRGHLYRILTNPIYLGQIAHKGTVYPGRHPAIVDPATWQAVQDQLATNRQGRRERARSSNPSLLAGLVFDAQGDPLTATHAKKGARRYRYYISHRLLQVGRPAARDALRVPAPGLEDAVVQGLARFLTDRGRLLELLESNDARDTVHRLEQAQRVADRLRQLRPSAPPSATTPTGGVESADRESSPASRIALLRQWVERITVSAAQIEIVVRLGALGMNGVRSARANDHARPDKSSSRTTVITLPVELKRCGFGLRLIVHAPGAQRRGTPDPRLVALLARANDWFGRLIAGQDHSILSIAQSERVSSSYVARVINLAFLAPDIVSAIARGQHPPALTASRLIRRVPLPISWSEQHARLGFDTPTTTAAG
jgi:DNA invertase Pin-like site-specific DNA recombinase